MGFGYREALFDGRFHTAPRISPIFFGKVTIPIVDEFEIAWHVITTLATSERTIALSLQDDASGLVLRYDYTLALGYDSDLTRKSLPNKSAFVSNLASLTVGDTIGVRQT
jgi:hypothetical protein